jgi:peptidyl-prolyl cis-trans isomerase D
MEAIAKSAGSTVLQATDVIMENPMLTGVGLEPKVVGTAFALGANKMSAPIEGNTEYMLLKT